MEQTASTTSARADGGKGMKSPGRAQSWWEKMLVSQQKMQRAGIWLLVAHLHRLRSGKTRAPLGRGGSDAAAERGAVQPGGGPGAPGLLVLLGQQQHEGHGQGAVVEAVHVGVIPLLQAGRALVRPAGAAGAAVLGGGSALGAKH